MKYHAISWLSVGSLVLATASRVASRRQQSDSFSRPVANQKPGGSLCDQGCPGGDEHSWKIGCSLYHRCVALSRNKGTHVRFPLFSEDWCDDQMHMVAVEACGTIKQKVNATELLLLHTQEVLRYINSTAHRALEEWTECEIVPENKQRSSTGQLFSDCEACTQPTHRGGVSRFQVTSFACAWDSLQGACRPSLDLSSGSVAIRSMMDCPSISFSDGTDHSLMSMTARHPGLLSRNASEHQDDQSLLEMISVRSTVKVRRRKALLIAYSYPGTKSSLDGTPADIQRVYFHLTKVRGFEAKDITVLTDDVNVRPYGFANVIKTNKESGTAAQFLQTVMESVKSLKKNDYFVFHFSGHGNYVEDRGGDELDKYDEIVNTPNGDKVVDDDFYAQLIRIPAGVRAFITVDACHSEGFSDLPFNYFTRKRTWCTDWAKPQIPPQAQITYLASSQNHERSVDKGFGGALSLYTLKAWTKPRTVHYAIEQLTRKLTYQNPSLSAFPTFRDTEMWCPYDPSVDLRRDPALGGKKPNKKARMRVPSICDHGTFDPDLIPHSRLTERYSAAKKEFLVDWRLDSATMALEEVVYPPMPVRMREDLVEGWNKKHIDDVVKPIGSAPASKLTRPKKRKRPPAEIPLDDDRSAS